MKWSADFAALIVWPIAEEQLDSLFSNNLL